jgi:hypothetical protein
MVVNVHRVPVFRRKKGQVQSGLSGLAGSQHHSRSEFLIAHRRVVS